jgi:hypothetical protein
VSGRLQIPTTGPPSSLSQTIERDLLALSDFAEILGELPDYKLSRGAFED